MGEPVTDSMHLKELTVKREYLANTPTSGGGHTHKVGDFAIKTNFRMGAWCCAVNATLDLNATGSVNGTGKAATSELIGPTGALSRGALYCHDFEIGGFASSTASAGPVGFMKLGYWGAADSHFDDQGFLMSVEGLTEGTGHLYSAGASAPAVTATFKIRVPGGGTKYIMLCDAEAN